MRRRRNPVDEAIIFATATVVGIVVGTVLSTIVVERMQAARLPAPPPAPPLSSGNQPPFVPGA